MSRSELLTAYQSGEISRRALVRGLISLGLTVTLANHLADRVTAAQVTGAGSDDTYNGGGGGGGGGGRDDEDEEEDDDDNNNGRRQGNIDNIRPVPAGPPNVFVPPTLGGPVSATTGEVIISEVGPIVAESPR
jgi:hypothetical protein